MEKEFSNATLETKKQDEGESKSNTNSVVNDTAKRMFKIICDLSEIYSEGKIEDSHFTFRAR
jgi:hypothetical protein